MRFGSMSTDNIGCEIYLQSSLFFAKSKIINAIQKISIRSNRFNKSVIHACSMAGANPDNLLLRISVLSESFFEGVELACTNGKFKKIRPRAFH